LRTGDPPRIGPYRLLGRLGAGGMGQVYLGRSAGGRLVAVKVIRPGLAGEPGFRARFAREVAAARTVSGLFTALVLDADTDGPVPWLATAYVPGPSLAGAVDAQGPLPAGSVPGWPRAWPPSTPRAWCTGTSSPPTCCWPTTGRG
jgi:eukaryotic-like serine/threonine-protein kinase